MSAVSRGPCKSCGAAVEWRRHADTGNLAPIDAEPAANGNVLIEADEEHYRIVPAPERGAYTGRLRLNHFVTCPNAAHHARRKGGAR